MLAGPAHSSDRALVDDCQVGARGAYSVLRVVFQPLGTGDQARYVPPGNGLPPRILIDSSVTHPLDIEEIIAEVLCELAGLHEFAPHVVRPRHLSVVPDRGVG